jgi:hypothetical protein
MADTVTQFNRVSDTQYASKNVRIQLQMYMWSNLKIYKILKTIYDAHNPEICLT